MRKFLLSLLFFVLACANAWGATYTHDYNANIQGSFNTSTKTLTITGTGAIPTCIDGNNYYSSNNSNIETVIINEGITSIGTYVFDEYTNLTSITFPSTLTSISNNNFGNSKKIVEIHASSPNQWAQVTISATSGHPFGTITGVDNDVKSSRGFYFNGSAKKSRALIFTQGLDSIRQYTFYNARYFTSAYIPGSVSRIGKSALMCYFDTVVVNRMDRPILNNSSTISFNNPSVLIVPTSATNFTEARYWLYSTASGKNSSGARSKNEQNVSGKVDGKDWSLSTSGVLTIDDSGAITTTFADADGVGVSQYPYYYFRYLVDKVVVTGGITALSNILQQCVAVQEVDINQAKMPSASATLPTLIHGGTIALMVNPAALADASASNLGTTPWTNAKFGNVTLSDNLVIGDNNANNSTVLANCSTYVEAPITLQLGRSLTNTQYNTICLPFALDNEQLEAVFGAGYDLEEFVSSSLEDDILNLSFNKATALVAGKPYLLQPAVDVEDPVFEGVTIGAVSPADQTSDTYISFHGTYRPTELEGGNKNLLFLGAGNELFYPSTTANIYGFRAYFELKGDAKKNGIRARIVKKEDMATGIESISDEGLPVTGKKILRNGQLYLMYEGKMYDVRGQLVK